MRPVLGVFAKHPLPGLVKTRLASVLGADAAAALYDAFLRDSLDRIALIDARRILAFTPPDAEEFFRDLARERFELEPQQGKGLGERMAAFFRRRFEQGDARVVLVGSDTPDLPIGHLQHALAELESREIVLGPCYDGGYYLIGMRQMFDAVFEHVDWSSGSVFRQTLAQIQRLVARLTVLEPWYDVDTVGELRWLAAHVSVARRAGLDPGVPHTEAALKALIGTV